MPSENQSGKDSQYNGDTDLRILHEGNDLMVRGLIEGITQKEHNEPMQRAQKLIKEESMNQNRSWVITKLERKIKELGEQE